MLTLPTVAYFVIRQNSVQQHIVRKLTTKISNFLGAPVTMSAADIDFFNNITLHNFCIQTPQHDTILYTPALNIKLNTFTLSSKFLEFKKVTLNKPKINFYVDSTNTINFQFIINKLESKDTTHSPHPMIVSIREIQIKDANFKLRSYFNSNRPYGINFTDIDLNPLNIRATNFRIDRGVSLNIRHFSASDHSGFVINDLSANFKINTENMVFNHVSLETPKSNIEAKQVHFKFKSTREFKTGIFGKRVKLNIELKPSDISADDLAYFLPILKDYHLKAKISGNFKGIFSDLKARDLNISYGRQTRIKANVDINGLPDIASSFLHVDIKSLYTTPADIESIQLPYSKNGKIILPNNFANISYITYKGKFTGFFNDFVAYGTISSNLGKLESDLSLRPDTAEYFSFNGQLKALQFDLGKFLGKSDLLGKISLNAMVNGVAGSSKNTKAKLNGTINSFFINSYNYQNIKIDGTLSNNTYDGALSISDPNLTFDFLGKVNLANHTPVFNFEANVKSARLYPLNFDKKDTSSFVSLYITANFEGNNIDNLNGEINLLNSKFRRAGKQIEIKDLLLFTKTVNDTNRIILRSDLADAEVWGVYQFEKLTNSFIFLARNYLPSVIKDNPDIEPSNNNFRFEVDFKNTRQLSDFFFEGLYISKDSKLTGTYNPSGRTLDFNMKVPLLQHKSKKWYNLYFNGKTTNNTFSLISGCGSFKMNQLEFKNLSLESLANNDSVTMRVRWNNWDTVSYKGNMGFAVSFSRIANESYPTMKIDVMPSQVILKDTIWSIKPGFTIINQDGVNIDELALSHNNQTIKIFGNIYKKQDHTLSAQFKNVDLGNISTVLNMKALSVGGIVNGDVKLSNIYNNPIFRASLTLDSFAFNHQRFGKTRISAVYESNSKEVKIEAGSDRGSIKTLDIKGSYGTVSKALNFKINVNKLKIDPLEPYISNIFSNVTGIATGTVNLTGTSSALELNGSVKVQKGYFRVNYLNTYYSFTNIIDIQKNTFLLKNVEINDSKGNKAIVNGFIEYRNLKDLYTDIKINATNFECLSTAEKDNNLYYGQGYATGNVRIRTSPQNVTMDINASTEPNTIVSIPLTAKITQTETGFIRIINKHKPIKPFEQYEIDNIRENKKHSTPSNFKLNCDLHVTPDASVQIVFDQKIGDMITGSGSGDLNLKVEGGRFNMYGKYTIDDGEYLFTLQNVINKKFIVDRGGTINWDGNPVDATIDIKAIYRLKASLYQLTADERYTKPIPVDCRLFLTDKLLSPTIQYDINLPNADPETKNLLYSHITNEEEKSEQFLALIISNNFMPNSNVASASSNGGLGINAARSTGLEFLSNQFSRMLSQISRDFDIGFNYRPGDHVSTGQAEMAISTQLLNDRVTINGNVDVGGNQTTNTNKNNSNNIVGEGSVEVKITPNGKLRMKAFNRSNQNNLAKTLQGSPYTQGVGIFYQEEFNSFIDLFKDYFNKIAGHQEEPSQTTSEDANND